MKTAIVYYSLEGNTKFVATQIAKELNADLLELQSVKKYATSGPMKYVVGGKDAVTGKKPELELYSFQKENYDLIIIGTPVWASVCAPPIRTFLTTENLTGKKIAFIACCGGGGTKKCFEQMTEMAHAKNPPTLDLVDPFTKNKPENIVAIKNFCYKLNNPN